jgi:hypothetical protein
MAKMKTFRDLPFYEILAWKTWVDEKVKIASASSSRGTKKQLKYWTDAKTKIDDSIISRERYYFGDQN